MDDNSVIQKDVHIWHQRVLLFCTSSARPCDAERCVAGCISTSLVFHFLE